MSFLEVVRCLTQCWKGDPKFRSQFSRFEKNSSLNHIKLENLASISYVLKVNQIAKLRSEICVTLSTMCMTTYGFEKRHFITVHPNFITISRKYCYVRLVSLVVDQ